MSVIENRIVQLGYALPEGRTPGATYVPTVVVPDHNLVYTAGDVARKPNGSTVTGKLGVDLSIEDGYEAAKLTALNLLGSLKAELGDLAHINRVIKLLCMVNSAPDFEEHPAVADGGSDLLVEIFGDKGNHARSAVGMLIPGNICISIDMIVEICP